MPSYYFYSYNAYPPDHTRSHQKGWNIWETSKDDIKEISEDIVTEISAECMPHKAQIILTAFNKVI